MPKIQQAAWVEFVKLYFPDYAVDNSTETAALLRSRSNPNDIFTINPQILAVLSKTYQRGYEDGMADADWNIGVL
jgi:hypothetical protein